jgi:hypothetical protein
MDRVTFVLNGSQAKWKRRCQIGLPVREGNICAPGALNQKKFFNDLHLLSRGGGCSRDSIVERKAWTSVFGNI